MKRVYQAAAMMILGLAAWVAFEAIKLGYGTTRGPGPGFFSLWLAVLLAILILVWLVQVSRAPNQPLPEGFLPDGQGALRILSVILALAAFAFILDIVGFRLAMLAMLTFLLFALGRQSPVMTAFVAVLGSFGTYFVITSWLGTSLPDASLEWLASMGL